MITKEKFEELKDYIDFNYEVFTVSHICNNNSINSINPFKELVTTEMMNKIFELLDDTYKFVVVTKENNQKILYIDGIEVDMNESMG